MHAVFNKSVEKFRDDSPGVKYIFTWWSLPLILMFKDKVDFRECPSQKQNSFNA